MAPDSAAGQPPGWHIIANPFDNGGNTLPEVLGEDWPFGTTIYQFDAIEQAYTATQMGKSVWLSEVQRLPPGAGAFIEAVTPSTLILGGLFDDSTAVPEPAGGWNLVGSTVLTSFAVAPEEGDQLVILAVNASYETYTFDFGWWLPSVPPVRLGEGYWYRRDAPASPPPGGGCVLFSNFGPTIGQALGAPQFDHIGCLIEGTNWLAQLYAGPAAGALASVGDPVTFLSGDEAGFFNTGSNAVRYIETVPPGGPATVQINLWMASSGATFDEALANGGPYGMTATLNVTTGGEGVGGVPPSLPAGLTGLTSSSGLGSIIPDVTGGGSYFVGGSARLSATHSYVTSRTVTYQWQRGGSPDILNDWADIDGATLPVHEISPLSSSDADLYRVRIEIGGCSAVGWSFPVEVNVLAPPSFSGPSVDPESGTLTFVLNAAAAFDYAIEYSSDLEHWDLLRTVLNPAGPVEIADSEAPEVQWRFYRARVLMTP